MTSTAVGAELGAITPFFIVDDLDRATAFYVDTLGFAVTYRGPQDDPYFAIVRRDRVQVMLKAITPEVHPVPNHTRHPWARWDAFVFTEAPDVLAAEFRSRDVSFVEPLEDADDGLRGFGIQDADGYVLYFGCPFGARGEARVSS
jgi:catechol 2,3-dioxygenase-like lactoylglutathione lyase family enzyme